MPLLAFLFNNKTKTRSGGGISLTMPTGLTRVASRYAIGAAAAFFIFITALVYENRK